jgi:hypothetical protein
VVEGKAMITTHAIKQASDAVRAKALRTRAFQRGNRVLVAPRDAGKALRLVEFNGNTVTCVAFETGEACPANEHGRYCYHALAALRRKEINRKARATRTKNRAA